MRSLPPKSRTPLLLFAAEGSLLPGSSHLRRDTALPRLRANTPQRRDAVLPRPRSRAIFAGWASQQRVPVLVLVFANDAQGR
jgi:hypothetical protein